MFFFSAPLEAGVLCSSAVILYALWFHGDSPGTEGEAIFREAGGINHLLSDDDRNDAELFIDVLVNLLRVIPSVQDDVGKRKIGISAPSVHRATERWPSYRTHWPG